MQTQRHAQIYTDTQTNVQLRRDADTQLYRCTNTQWHRTLWNGIWCKCAWVWRARGVRWARRAQRPTNRCFSKQWIGSTVRWQAQISFRSETIRPSSDPDVPRSTISSTLVLPCGVQVRLEEYKPRGKNAYKRWIGKCTFHFNCSRKRTASSCEHGPLEPLAYVSAWNELGAHLSRDEHVRRACKPSAVNTLKHLKDIPRTFLDWQHCPDK